MKRILKFVRREVTPLRTKVFNDLKVEKTTERKLVLEVEAKRALAIEKLLLSMVIMIALPDDLEEIAELLESVVDLQECFKNLKLGESVKQKKAKLTESERP